VLHSFDRIRIPTFDFGGMTDTVAVFKLKERLLMTCLMLITKNGYYKLRGKYWFYRRDKDCVQNDRWQPWNPTYKVVLKEHRQPIAMYAKIC
jgi:hypothetical protein